MPPGYGDRRVRHPVSWVVSGGLASSDYCRLTLISDVPLCSSARIGHVGAIRAGADSAAEMLAELVMVLGDAGDCLADGAGHTGSGALGRRGGSSVSTAQANGAGEFSKQEVAFSVGLCGAFAVSGGLSLLDVVVDLGEASAIGVFGLRVEHLPRVAECRPRQAGGVARLSSSAMVPVSAATRSSTWYSRSGSASSRAQVVHALDVAHADGGLVEDHRPVVTLATKHVDARQPFADRVRRGPRGPLLGIPTARLRSLRGSCGPRGAPSRPGARYRWQCGRRRGRGGRAPPRRGRRLRSTVAPRRTGTVPRRPHRRRRGAPVRGRGRRRRPTLCSRIEWRRAPARRRPVEPGRCRRTRSAIATCASSNGARCRSLFGGRSLDGTRNGRSSASRIETAAAATSPWARRTSARAGWGSQPARWAANRASSAPAMSPWCSRIRPSSFSGHPSSRRKYGRSSSHAINA